MESVGSPSEDQYESIHQDMKQSEPSLFVPYYRRAKKTALHMSNTLWETKRRRRKTLVCESVFFHHFTIIINTQHQHLPEPHFYRKFLGSTSMFAHIWFHILHPYNSSQPTTVLRQLAQIHDTVLVIVISVHR